MRKEKRFFSFLAALSVMFCALGGLFTAGNALAQSADGSYDVPFELKEAGNDNTSIANGYFETPAQFIIADGEQHVDITITSSQWVKSVSGPFGQATVISEDKENDARKVRLQLGDLSKPIKLNMHVVVPEEIAGMAYDHNHTVRIVFDVPDWYEPPEPPATGEDAPQTGDKSSTGLFVTLALCVAGLIVIFFVYKWRVAAKR